MRHSRETDAAQTVRQTETAKSTQRSFNLPVSLVPCSLAQRAWCGCRCRSILSMWPQSSVVVCAGSCRQCPIRCVLSVQVSDMISSRDCRRRRQPSRALAAASLASHQLISAVRCAALRCGRDVACTTVVSRVSWDRFVVGAAVVALAADTPTPSTTPDTPPIPPSPPGRRVARQGGTCHVVGRAAMSLTTAPRSVRGPFIPRLRSVQKMIRTQSPGGVACQAQ